jgi:putative ABC transport system substrate-binding protein
MSVMRRPDLVRTVLLVLGLLAATNVAMAQATPSRMPSVGFLALVEFPDRVNQVRAALEERGWIDGKTMTWDARFAEGRPERRAELAAQLASSADVVVAFLGGDVVELQRATRTVPIVVWGVHGAVGSGLVSSLARPGGNVTGLDSMAPEVDAKRVEILRELMPRLRHLSVLYDPADPGSAQHLGVTASAGSRYGIGIKSHQVRRTSDIEGTLATIESSRPDGLLPFTDYVTVLTWQRVADFAVAQRIPTMCEFKFMAQMGCLVSYGPNPDGFAEVTARLVDRILRGTKPGDLPVEQPTRFELVLNLKVARALGVTIPQPLLLRADHLIE